jgi:hypothetical protein
MTTDTRLEIKLGVASEAETTMSIVSAMISYGQAKPTFTAPELMDFLYVMGFEPEEYSREVFKQATEGCLTWADDTRTLLKVRG